LKQNEIEAAAIMMRIFHAGLALNFDVNFHELEEVTNREFRLIFGIISCFRWFRSWEED
jgi:hypothetical protein